MRFNVYLVHRYKGQQKWYVEKALADNKSRGESINNNVIINELVWFVYQHDVDY